MITVILLILIIYYLKEDNYPSELDTFQENRKGGSEAASSSQDSAERKLHVTDLQLQCDITCTFSL